MLNKISGIIVASVMLLTMPGAEGQGGAPPPQAKVCCDGGAQQNTCEYTIYDPGGQEIASGELNHNQCITLGPAFSGFVICDCNQS